jgi:hypothetical protein
VIAAHTATAHLLLPHCTVNNSSSSSAIDAAEPAAGKAVLLSKTDEGDSNSSSSDAVQPRTVCDLVVGGPRLQKLLSFGVGVLHGVSHLRR